MEDDSYKRADEMASMSQSQARKTQLKSTMMRKQQDPYTLDFTELRKEYVDQSSVKIPFVKSTFVHYSKCPRQMRINGKEYKDLIVTMEVIQAPEHLKYTSLEDPAKAKEIAKKAKKAEKEAALEAAKAAKIAARKEAADHKRQLRRAERAAAKEERQRLREERRNNRIQSGEGSGDESEEPEESEEEESDYDDEHDPDDDDEDAEHEEEDEDYDEETDDYGDYGDYGDSDDEDSHSGTEEETEEGEDRLYAGNMFGGKDGKKPVKFQAAPFEKLGQRNEKLETNDYCCITIWSAGGLLQRFTRLKDTTLRVPPVGARRRFRIGHDAKRIYYLGELDGVKKLVIVYLKDLTHEFIDLGPEAEQIHSFEDSSLFKDYLCYKLDARQEVEGQGKKFWRTTKNFRVLNFRKQELIWELPDCESVFFKGKLANDTPMVTFKDQLIKLREHAPLGSDDEADEDELKCEEEDVDDVDSDADEEETQAEIEADGKQNKWDERIQRIMKGILVVKSKLKDRKEGEDDDKKDDGKAEDKPETPGDGGEADEGKKVKVTTKRIIQAYYPQWGKQVNKKRLAFYYELDAKMNPVPEKLGEEETTDGPVKRVKELQENKLLLTADHSTGVVSMIVRGNQGDQHQVLSFTESKRGTTASSSRAGNTILEYNMNNHLRDADTIAICETAPNGDVTAKKLALSDSLDLIPPVSFEKPERGCVKDCWVVDLEEGVMAVYSLCKSSTDEYLNSNLTILSWVSPTTGEKVKMEEMMAIESEIEAKAKLKIKADTIVSKIRAQEIDLNYPCLVSNVGLSRINIQSLTCPNEVQSFNLEHQNMEFICFADYLNLTDIGFCDPRPAEQQALVPFSETGDKIAFVTRFWNREDCADEEDEPKGEMLLNVLSIDSYSSPMRFELFTTHYDAKMDEGMSDDAIQTCIAMQVTSQRGIDVAFIAQYNDRIIYDCITSEKQLPLRFPLPANNIELAKWQEADPDYQKKPDGDDVPIMFEQVDAFKNAEMVRQPMILDGKGALYFMTKNKDNVKVLRTDPTIEMGAHGFIKSVYALRTSLVYFLLYREGNFYLMDDQKKIRVLKPDDETNMWTNINTLEIPEGDAKSLVYSDFDEFCISDSVLHSNNKMYFLVNSRNKETDTWSDKDIMLDNHQHISGPRYAKENGLIWYIQQFNPNLEGDDDEGEEDDHAYDLHGEHKVSHFKGFSVVLQPLGDLSYVDLLPQRGENHKNFTTFVSDHHVMVNFGGRFLIFDLKGAYQGSVKFTGTGDGFRENQIKLVNVSDSGKYFVFQGKKFLTKAEQAEKRKAKQAKEQKQAQKKKQKKEQKADNLLLGDAGDNMVSKTDRAMAKAAKEAKKAAEKKSGSAKADIFYIFKLSHETKLDGSTEWSFQPFDTKLYPWIEKEIMHTMTQRIDHSGVLSQCLLDKQEFGNDGKDRLLHIKVKNYKSQDPNMVEQARDQVGLFSFQNVLPETPDSEEQYIIQFKATSAIDKELVLDRKIKNMRKAVSLGRQRPEALERLQTRRQQVERAWVFDNYVVAKSGCELKFIQREKSVLGSQRTNAIAFQVEPEAEVWIQNIFSTGIEDLIQLFIIDDINNRLFIITWNLQLNREHSIFQTTYDPQVFPENLIMKGKHYKKQDDFNYFMDSYAIVNLETNLPIQFFDTENEQDVLPKGPLTGLVEGMKRISSDWSRYLDITKPGRVHHFISYADLLYWERFQLNKDRHEISKGTMSTFSPIARFPKGISVFHHFATNVKVLHVVQDALQMARQKQSADARVNFLPLVFLHSYPRLSPGRKTTPIHIALDKQSPIAFDIMFEMLVDQQRVCVTQQLLDVLPNIIGNTNQSVLDFFNSSFLITDQFAGLHALEWEREGEEFICATPTAYLTGEYLQSLVKTTVEEETVVEELDDASHHSLGKDIIEEEDDAPCKYSLEVETQVQQPGDSAIRQIEAKILDFNWVFTGDNSDALVAALADTDNDEIFAQSQVRVFIDFMWQGYYTAIFNQLFAPFIVYFVTFVAYTGYFAKLEGDELSFNFVAEITCIVFFGKTFFTFLILEMIQIRSCGWSLEYFTDIWNMIDLSSLILNALYLYGEVSNTIAYDNMQIIGAIAIMLMWFKLFYWMRLFQPFSAFIRMITEIIKDIKVFLIMLIISLGAFANIIFVLNANRIQKGEPVIFDPLVNVAPIDALIHSYLTGLGDFNKDNYSAEDGPSVWVMFILATVIVQLIFLNLLIAIMGESFARINAIIQQSTLKEMCGIMLDHIWLQKVEEIFADKRYILWLTPDTSTSGGTVVERQLAQLKELIKSNADSQEARILRAIGEVKEDVSNLSLNVEEISVKQEKQIMKRSEEEGHHSDEDY